MNFYSRESVVEKLASAEFDVLVIGGGVTGVGAALDAATGVYGSPSSKQMILHAVLQVALAN